MPTAAKTQENMTKHLTKAELADRAAAEAAVIPNRLADLKKPKLMAKNSAAGRYWRLVLERMEGLEILDDLDAEALGIYCVMLSRYELLSKSVPKLLEEAEDPKAIKLLTDLEGKVQSLERDILNYAEKLGLTPSGRARLAAKRASAAEEDDPDGDLFG